MSRHGGAERKSWWRKLFDDHPGAASQVPEAFVISANGKTRTKKKYCSACFPLEIRQIIAEDHVAADQGRQINIRTEDEIISYRKFSNTF